MNIKEAYCADWIVPVSGPAMRGAALIVQDGEISAIVPQSQLQKRFKGLRVRTFKNAVILPAWVNAHTHLELSYLSFEKLKGTSFLNWVENLLDNRTDEDEQTVVKAARQQMQLMRQSGTALVGDITNGHLLKQQEDEPLKRVVFYEILGFRSHKAKEIFEAAKKIKQAVNPQAHLTPHAPYSTSAHLLQLLNEAAERISIHLSESREEAAFFLNGSVEMNRFLKARGAYDQKWKTPRMSPVAYMEQLGLLHENALIVHGLQVSESDVKQLANSGATVCLCLRSNHLLHDQLPPVDLYLQHAVPLCLGTDSLASNFSLDMNDEIHFAFEHFPQIDPGMLIKMATLNGARILGMEQKYGSLEAGKKAAFNVFEFEQPVEQNPELAVVSRKWSRLKCF